MKTINSFRSKLLALTLALVASVSTFAYDFVFANDFHIDGFGYKIISNNEPRAVELREIADCTEDVVIPATVTYNGLQYIVSTVGMGGSIITNDARITIKSIFIPKTIQVVNMRALSDCPHLCSIVVDEENPYLDSRNDCNAIVTSKDWGSPANTLIAGCQTTTIPNSVTEIGDYAFYRCDSLKHMTVPNGVTTINNGAFSECSSLSSIKLPESLTNLSQQWIFDGCTSLKEVFFFAKTPPYIAYGMFRGLNPTIFVPKESLDAYKNELYWQDFDIQAIPYKSQWCDTWNVMWFDAMRFDVTARTSQYRLGKDTIIGDYTYSKFIPGTFVRFTDDRKVYVYHEYFDDHDPYSEDLPTGEYLAYDFSAQVGDTLEVFSGVHSYSKYKCLVREVQTDPETKLRTITLFQLLLEDTDGDGVEEEYALGEMTWIEGVGSSNGFLIGTTLPGGGTYALLCAYNDDELKYTGDLYDEYGCEYNATEQKPEDLFPTLWGLQRTSFTEYSECSDSYASLFQSKGETITINDNQYLKFGGHYLREENKQVLLYSRLQDKDLVLYDYSLEVGDTLTTLNIDYRIEGIPFDLCYVDYAYEDVGMSHSIDTLIVTDVSYVTLLDGKEYKKWTFDNGMEYVEGIGMYGGRRNGNFFGLIQEVVVPCHIGTHLVCASRNGKLLYQMDEAEMERLGAECLCDYNSGPKKDNAKNGKIGGRPTPTQWNMLEVETKEMDGTPTILRAETFSYTLENDSIVAKGKTFYQLARQSTKDTAITKSFVGALHFGEDEDNRVYFLRDGVEYVLYDFTAEPGDTIEIFAGINNYPLDTTYTHVVTGKDTLENGACRMMLEVVFPEETSSVENAQKVWLAGLGSIDGIVHNAAQRTSDAHAAPAKSASSETQTSVMLCAWRDDDCLYTTDHPDYDSYGCVYNLPTSIKDIETPGGKYQKIIRDGHLYILRDNKLYDVLGTPMN